MSTKIDATKFLETERKLSKLEKLRFISAYQHNEDMPLSEFLWNLLHSYNYIWDTYTSKGKTGTNGILCARGKHRSITDLYPMVLFYYPKTTLYELKKLLVDWLIEDKINYRMCSTIKRGTYYPVMNGNGDADYRASSFGLDEFGWDWNYLPDKEELDKTKLEPEPAPYVNPNALTEEKLNKIIDELFKEQEAAMLQATQLAAPVAPLAQAVQPASESNVKAATSAGIAWKALVITGSRAGY